MEVFAKRVCRDKIRFIKVVAIDGHFLLHMYIVFARKSKVELFLFKIDLNFYLSELVNVDLQYYRQ